MGVKFYRGYEKNMSSLVVPKSPIWWGKVGGRECKSGHTPLNHSIWLISWSFWMSRQLSARFISVKVNNWSNNSWIRPLGVTFALEMCRIVRLTNWAKQTLKNILKNLKIKKKSKNWFKSVIFSKKSFDLNRDLNQWFKSLDLNHLI